MKIGIFLNNLSPIEGGGYTFEDDLFKSLIEILNSNKQKHDFIIYCNLRKSEIEKLNLPGLHFITNKNSLYSKIKEKIERWLNSKFLWIKYIRRNFRFQNWFEKSLKRNEVKFVWFLSSSYIEIDLPYIYTILDIQHRLQPWFPEVSANGAWELREKFYYKIITRASQIIAANNSIKEDLIRCYNLNPERIKMLPHPTPSFSLNPNKDNSEEILKKNGITSGYLFYPAQFWPHKNHYSLLATTKLLQEKHHLKFEVVLVGSDKGNLEYTKHLVKKFDLEKQVHFLGFVSRDDLIDLYRHAFALVFLSFFGPENLPPLEAYALGCPVIASDVPGVKEQLGDAAILVNPKNIEEIANAIKSFSENKKLREKCIQLGMMRANRWTAKDYIQEVFTYFDEFEPIRHCWP